MIKSMYRGSLKFLNGSYLCIIMRTYAGKPFFVEWVSNFMTHLVLNVYRSFEHCDTNVSAHLEWWEKSLNYIAFEPKLIIICHRNRSAVVRASKPPYCQYITRIGHRECGCSVSSESFSRLTTPKRRDYGALLNRPVWLLRH